MASMPADECAPTSGGRMDAGDGTKGFSIIETIGQQGPANRLNGFS